MYEVITVPHEVHDKDPATTWPFEGRLDAVTVKDGRAYLNSFHEHLAMLFQDGYRVNALLKLRSDFIDNLLTKLYRHFDLDKQPSLSVIAVGGFGRQELFLRSDIDILVLTGENLSHDEKNAIGNFISFLWDLKLDIGSSVRSIKETVLESRQDLTVETNLLERRLICGSQKTFDALTVALDQDHFWDPKTFLRAKLKEQIERHHLYKDTAYLLEPDIKNNPGGLRDIQVMQWIANFHFKAQTLEDTFKLGLLSQSEYEELKVCRDFLFATRYALHVTINREDNRLTLDTQKNVARLLGYGDEGNRPVEKMMRAFFRVVRRVRELNSMTLQLETLRITGHLGDNDEPQFLSSYFVRRGPLIDVTDPDLFVNEPWRMLEIFHEISRHPDILGLHVNCLRILREARRSLNFYLMEMPQCRKMFRHILEDYHSLTTTLPLMHEHRMLSAYMQQWENIEGLTQFDMFHTFSVDEHIIRVLKNIAVFSTSTQSVHALFRNVYHQLSEPSLLQVAAFLHDIAKGRGGHHAAQGAREATYFCQLHGFTQYQSRMVTWLVENHLVMSSTALRRDITDPAVVTEFARQMQDEEHLNLLYCLSVADIAATNDHEWTSWKDTIFRQLYFAARQALRQGLESPMDLKLHVRENQAAVLKLLKDVPEENARTLWNDFAVNYFIQYHPQEIAWHTRNILRYAAYTTPLVLFAEHSEIGTEAFIYVKEKTFKFPHLACVMARKNLNVQSAQIMQTKSSSYLCTIRFQTRSGQCLDHDRLHSLRRSLLDALNLTEVPELPKIGSQIKRTQSIFNVKPVVTFLDSGSAQHSSVEISTLDTPGLLARIGITLGAMGCQILSARITTTGERADDFFTIVNAKGEALDDVEQNAVSKSLLDALRED